MPRNFLRQGIDRDVYSIVLKIDADAAAPNPRLGVSAVYDAIKRSNSSLARRKKRELEDSIERVLSQRNEDLRGEFAEGEGGEEDEEEKVIKEAEARVLERDSFLLNKQIAKAWKFGTTSGTVTPATSAAEKNADDVEMKNAEAAETPNGDKAERQANGEPSAKRRRTERREQRERDREGGGGGRAAKEKDRSPPTGVSIRDVAGVDATLKRLLSCVWLPLRGTAAYAQMNYRCDFGVLLHGPSGCGKTTLAHAVAASVGVSFIPVSSASLVGGTSGESEKNIRDIFDEAIALAPCLIFMDEIDSIGGKRESAQKAMEGRMVAELINGMDRVALNTTAGKNVVVLAATSRPDTIDPAIRRRFGVEVAMGMPDEKAREHILRSQSRGLPLDENVDFVELAKATPGYNGADLKHVVTAAMNSALDTELDNVIQQVSSQKPGVFPSDSEAQREWFLLEDQQTIDWARITITMGHFQTGVSKTQPASKREGFTTIPDTNWSHVGALHDIRKKLEMSIIGPIKQPELFAKVGIKPAAGILLWGPPGCGKTLVAKAVANESKANFISIKGPELLNKYVGESERAVRQVFERARASAPCILFFDEMDALMPKRDDSLSDASARVVNTLLTELDGVGDRSGIYVVGATNRPDMIDPAIRRPGRLGTSVYVGLPSPDERVDILRTLYRNTIPADHGARTVPAEVLEAVARDKRCDGFSGADLGNLMQSAAQSCLERVYGSGEEPVISMADWERALREVKPSVKDMRKYESLRSKGI
ncbi:AAA-domain-containing protein [Coniochaeta ligniaria NRRL 30616]|uniref:Peroxisomal ATPase PEX1 n=1 Tax=Coniochaeta ligniaria NRRL 30616 TaxID=1408157 RepID=A0A1J7IIS3_9PEZI|nr:AAA-domain-containing protein [Coniochaeta ligniaria NRRL 30616]